MDTTARGKHIIYTHHIYGRMIKKDILNNQLVVPNTKLDSLADSYDEVSYAKFRQNDYAPEKIHQKALTRIIHRFNKKHL